MKKITVIGANSYIARNLIHILCEKSGYELHLYDVSATHKDKKAPYKSVNIFSGKEITEIRFDVDIIYMFIGKTGSSDGFENPDAFIDINEKSLLYVMNEYVRQGSRAKIIFPSTRLLYDHNPKASEEDVSQMLNTIYAVNKLACEKYLDIYHRVFDVNYCIARICIPYGTLVSNASSYGTVDFMLTRAKAGENISLYGRGTPKRSLIFMGDLCKALIKLAEAKVCINDVYNIGGEEYSLEEMANLISVEYKIGVDYVDYPEIDSKIESGDTVFDDSKLRKIIGEYISVRFCEWLQNEHMDM